MDPADTDSLPQTLAGQHALLEQHDHALKTLLDHVKDFSRSLSELQGRFSAQSPQPAPSVPLPSVSPPPREPFVPAPDRYDGNPGACRDFLVQCSLVFEQQPHSYASDRAKIAYLIGSLRGAALSWATAMWEKQSLISSSYPHFIQEMRKVFDHPVRGKDAARRLLSLRQGPRSVAELAIEFRTLAAESGWNEEALQGAFQNALSENLKDELVSRDEPGGLDELIALAIRIDNRLRERRRERTGKVSPSLPPSASQPGSPPPSACVSKSVTEPEPMQLGRAHLSPEERQRRINSRCCLYCGQVGHYLSSCRLRPVKGVAPQ